MVAYLDIIVFKCLFCNLRSTPDTLFPFYEAINRRYDGLLPLIPNVFLSSKLVPVSITFLLTPYEISN
jgi:hypothetical protein